MDPATPSASQNQKKRPRSSMAPKPEIPLLPEIFASQSTIHTVGMGITGAAPPNSRVEVKRFAQVVPILEGQIKARLALCTHDYSSVDLDVSALRYRSPEIAIAESIEEASKMPEINELKPEDFMELVDVPNFQNLQTQEKDAHLSSIDHIKFVRKAIAKVRSKNVNYLTKPMRSEVKKEAEELTGKEVILSVSLSAPVTGTPIQEFLVLSTQPLTALKDAFYCVQDQAPIDLSRPDETASSATQSAVNTSGFFFIDGVFYNDTRNAENKDYATEIANWMKSGSSPYWSPQPIKIAQMQDTKFEDLIVQVGKKYLYCHRAKCEHLITITAVRAIAPDDDLLTSSYPILIYQAKYRQRKCTICERNVAKWITSGDSFSIEDPSYYCTECYNMAHRNEGGSTVRTGFKTLPYLHD